MIKVNDNGSKELIEERHLAARHCHWWKLKQVIKRLITWRHMLNPDYGSLMGLGSKIRPNQLFFVVHVQNNLIDQCW